MAKQLVRLLRIINMVRLASNDMRGVAVDAEDNSQQLEQMDAADGLTSGRLG